mgnify:FL=1
MPKFFIQTFGCRSNQADSAALRDGFRRQAMTECHRAADAGLLVVNTCTVTHRSDQQARQAVRSLHRKNPDAAIVVTGCYAERDPGALARLPGVALVAGNAAKDRLPELLAGGDPGSRGRILRPPLGGGPGCPVPPMAATGGKTRPLVKIQDGCDARCSYCIVPRVRGPGRSARPEDVLAEIRSLAGQGFREIVLTGVHLGTYGRRRGDPMRLPELLERITEVPGLGRIRLSSIEPMFFDRAVAALVGRNPVFARHFHIPLQSGSDRILRRMRRPYTAGRFRAPIEHIHGEIPDAAIGTDVIAGFPGESDEDFSETCSLVRALPLAYLHVFPFSPREQTEAWALDGRVPPGKVRERLQALLELSRAKSLAFRRRFAGAVLQAITLSREDAPGSRMALTGNYIHARIPDLSIGPNRLVDIRIEEAAPDHTRASVLL